MQLLSVFACHCLSHQFITFFKEGTISVLLKYKPGVSGTLVIAAWITDGIYEYNN